MAKAHGIKQGGRRWAWAFAVVLLVAGVCAGARWYGAWALKQRYPQRFMEEVSAACGEFEMDPPLVLAVIHTESSFRQDAVSSVGAMGLMQIMPETGRWIATKIGPADFEPALLENPALNVRYGVWYLRFLAQRYEGDAVAVLAAYHQGQGTVDAWLAQNAGALALEDVPSALSRQYIKKVLTAYEQYQTLYASQIA